MVSPLPGRGGQQHKYLQQLIKRWAENRGYTVTIEKPILGGLGLVDVALEKSGRAIACEISVTTDAEHEAGNVQKCLAGGFEQVIVVSTDKKVLAKIHGAVAEALPKEQLKKVRFMAPEELFSFIESLEASVSPALPGSSKDLLTAKELEELLRIDVKTIYSYAQRGLIPYVKIQSNLRFVRADIMTWMAEQGYKPPTTMTQPVRAVPLQKQLPPASRLAPCRFLVRTLFRLTPKDHYCWERTRTPLLTRMSSSIPRKLSTSLTSTLKTGNYTVSTLPGYGRSARICHRSIDGLRSRRSR